VAANGVDVIGTRRRAGRDAHRPGADARRVGGHQLDAVGLIEVRAALQSGAAPGVALQAGARDPAIERVARAVRLGQPLGELAAEIDSGDITVDLLVRALAVVERAGAGAVAAVDQALAAAADASRTERMLQAKTAQAKGTTRALTAMPVAVWALLVAMNGTALAFYATPIGVATGAGALALAGGGYWWSRRLVSSARSAADATDPLVPVRPPLDKTRMVALAGPALAVGLVLGGLGLGLLAGCLGAAVGAHRPRPVPPEAERARGGPGGDTDDGARRRKPASGRSAAQGGAAEAVEIVAIALDAGLAPAAAAELGASFVSPRARPALESGARRLAGGWSAENAFAETGLGDLGTVLGATTRWGAPSGPGLRRLAAELRDRRRSAAETAAERTQLALVFPMTLLTLPAFVLGVVPPLVWTAFST
jgi:hypothetical protein